MQSFNRKCYHGEPDLFCFSPVLTLEPRGPRVPLFTFIPSILLGCLASCTTTWQKQEAASPIFRLSHTSSSPRRYELLRQAPEGHQSLDELMMQFQREGVQFALRHGGRVLIGDEMGLGKTVQACALLQSYRDEWPALIMAPSSLRGQWADALKQVCGGGGGWVGRGGRDTWQGAG